MTETKRGTLVFTDISGYTRFTRLHFTSLLHAEEIISELLEAVIHAVEFPLKVGQLEGDAVLLFAEASQGQEIQAAEEALQQMDRLFNAFYMRERALIACDNGCVCDACAEIGQLRLKAVMHFGEFRLETLGETQTLTGDDVKLLRTLIKLPIPETEYILLTSEFYMLSGELESRPPDRRVPIFPRGEALVYFPRITSPAGVAVKGAGPAFSGRINRHAFARMFGLVPRKTFANLEHGSMNLLLYLLEGTQSGINLVVRALRKRLRRKGSIEVKNAALVLFEIYANQQGMDEIIQQVFQSVVATAPPRLLLNKLEGDAAFFFTPSKGDSALIARDTARRVGALVRTFETEKAARGASADGLRLKIILHFGQVAFKQIGNFEELAGTDVILIHRLLKTDLPWQAGAVMTERFYLLSGGLEGTNPETRTEHAEGLGNALVRVCDLGNT